MGGGNLTKGSGCLSASLAPPFLSSGALEGLPPFLPPLLCPPNAHPGRQNKGQVRGGHPEGRQRLILGRSFRAHACCCFRSHTEASPQNEALGASKVPLGASCLLLLQGQGGRPPDPPGQIHTREMWRTYGVRNRVDDSGKAHGVVQLLLQESRGKGARFSHSWQATSATGQSVVAPAPHPRGGPGRVPALWPA